MSLVVYKSSAGSGKTTTLVNEYLSLALKNPDYFASIIGLTFTIKATGEMKERVFTVLEKIINLDKHRDDPGLMAGLKHIQKKTGFDESKIRQQARILMRNILHQYSDFSFSTIDSFVVGIVRSFARDLNLPVDFNIELNADVLLEQAVDRVFARIGNDAELTDFLINFIIQKIEEEKGFDISRDLQDLGKNLFQSKHYEAIDKLGKLSLTEYKSIINQLRKTKKQFETKAAKIAKEQLDLIDSTGIEHSLFTGTNYPNQLKKIINGAYKPDHKIITDPDKIIKPPAKNKREGAAIYEIKEQLMGINSQLIELFESDYKKWLNTKLILEKINPVALLSELKIELDHYCEEQNIIHISESNKKISEIVLNEHIPFIYERVGRRYQHFLIDEFQDTSVIQWQNLLPLVDNSLAGDNFDMIVGDAKQSIYRWRDGDVDQFIKLPEITGAGSSEILKSREETLKRHYKPEVLKHNYRSELNIIEFNNLFIKYLTDTFSVAREGLEFIRIQKVYENFEQKAGKTKSNGKVVLQNFPKDGDSFDKKIIEYIYDLQLQGYRLKDITIIARKSAILHKMAELLIKNNIPVVSSDTLYIHNNPDIRLLVSIISFIAGLERKKNLLNIMLILSRKAESGGNQLLQSNKNTIQKPGKEDDIQILAEVINIFGYSVEASILAELQTYDLAEYIIQKLRLNQPANPFIQSLLDNIIENAQNNGAGHQAFCDFWELKKGEISISLPENIDAVKLYTIHKSKGLEFPVVIFIANGFNRKGDIHWIDPKVAGIDNLDSSMIAHKSELENSSFAHLYRDEADKMDLDELNMIYVAITRASEQLFILSDQNQSFPLWKKFEGFLDVDSSKANIIDENLLIYGKMTSQTTARQEESGSEITFLPSNNWEDRIRIRKRAHRNNGEQTERMQYGSLIHELLSKINTIEDIDAVVHNATISGTISVEESRKLAKTLLQILKHPDVAPYFQKNLQSIKEAGILLPDGRERRPDKVIPYPDRTLIIDYKASDYESISDKEKQKHFKQLNEYRGLLEEMGYPNIEAQLIYLLGEIAVVKVSQ